MTVLKAPKLTSTAHIHECLNVPTLKQRRDEHCSTQMYKVSKNLAPRAVLNMFKPLNQGRQPATRRKTQGNYALPRCELAAGKRNFRYRGVQNWEEVPTDIKGTETLASFKRNAKKHWRGKYPNGIT